MSDAAAPEPNPEREEPARSDAPPIADGALKPLDPRFVAVERIAGWITTAALSFAASIALVLTVILADLPAWADLGLAGLWLLASAGLGWLSHRLPEIEHRHAAYRVAKDGVEIRRGIWWRSAIHVPRSRVQHTDVAQGPLERRYGLGRVIMHTAGTDYAQVELPGLDHATALRIRDHLLPRDEDGAGDDV